jgi:hypothetical protein
MWTKRVTTYTVAWIGLALAATAALGAGGRTVNDPQTTHTNVQMGAAAEGVIASVTVQHVGYELNSVAGKYRLVPILLRAAGRPGPVTLSREQDRLVVISGTARIPASFELSALDRALWDSLAPQTRTWLTYPDRLDKDGAVMVYAFAPLAELKTPPTAFEYTIKSLATPLLLRPEAAKAAALTGAAGG